MGYYSNRNDGCAFILFLPFFLAWYVIKFVLAIAACCLVIPVRLLWLFITIPVCIFKGEDHTADWDDADFISSMWHIFFPER